MFAALENHAFAGYDLCDRDAAGDHRSGISRGIAKVERDHAHAAFYVAPHSRHSAQTARRMMEADAGGSSVEWAGVGTDNPLTEVRDLQPFVAQVVFNELGHRPVARHVPGLLVLPEPVVNLFAGGTLPDPQIAFTCL